MRISNNIPRWYHFDSSYNTKEDAEKRISELRKENRTSKRRINIRLMKRNEKMFSVFTYEDVYFGVRAVGCIAKSNGT